MPSMISLRRASTSSRVHDRRIAFWLISRPEVATPPALEACLVRTARRCARRSSPLPWCWACYAPRRPRPRRSDQGGGVVAVELVLGRARQRDLHRHMPRTHTRLGSGRRRARRIRPRGVVVVLDLHEDRQLLGGEAGLSITVPLESEQVIGLAPSPSASIAYWATLPEPDTETRMPLMSRPARSSMALAKGRCRSRSTRDESASRRRTGPLPRTRRPSCSTAFHHAGHEADLAATHADVAGGHVGVGTDVTVQLDEGLAEAHDLTRAAALGIEVELFLPPPMGSVVSAF